MDPRLEQALQASQNGQVFQDHLKLIQIKVKNKMIFGYEGGLFTANPELITFISTMRGIYNDFVAIDNNNIPVTIKDPSDFLNEATNTYTQAANGLQKDYHHLSNLRDLRSVVNKITGDDESDD